MNKDWVWNQKQMKIINSVKKEIYNPDNDTVRAFIYGGIGSGKSVSILYLIDLICQMTPGMTALVLRRTFESLKTDTFNILKREPGILSPAKGTWKANGKEFHYNNGSVIFFSHLEKNDSLLGPSYGLIYVEQVELCSEDDFRLLLGRLRQYGPNHAYGKQYAEYIEQRKILPPKNYLLLSANPKNNWVKERILEKGDYLKILLTTYDNKHNLPKDYINDNESEAYKKRFYEGKWEALSGLCYPEFKDGNLVDVNYELMHYEKALGKTNLGKFQNYVIVDPGIATSKFAVMFACVMPDNTVYIYDEISRNGAGTDDSEKVYIPEMSLLIKEKLKHYNIKEYIGIVDYAANAKDGSGASKTQQFNENGINLINSIKRIAGTTEFDSIMRINALFKSKKILLNPRCVSTIRELETWSWKVDKHGVPTKDEPENKSNDFMDCLRYLINAGPFAMDKREAKTNWTQKEVMTGFMENLFNENNPLGGSGKTQTPIIHRRTALDFGVY